ncbi:LLM class flavin-dependent oxidoreductase [Micromonospora sp. NPDC018662]|uniref:LLM class flavin-dependent oxidoreductase n=1 Tax=Micromonospora sp. NPDC018662 TaxID=3364238 RepID=UPI0037B50B24
MKFGVSFFPVMDPKRKSASTYYDESLHLVQRAEAFGYEHVQTVEHYGSPYGGYSPDPVAFLAAAAARTSRIRLTTGAVIAAFTHPVKLAAALAMLDNLSHGRLDVGFGRAFLPEEFEAFGVSMAESRARFDEGIAACVALWTGEDVTFTGRFHRFGPFTSFPAPFQRPHPPVFVASATSPESCAAAGRAGHHIQVVPSVTSHPELLRMIESYRAARTAAGHAEPGRIQIKYSCYVAEDREVALTDARAQEEHYVSRMTAAVSAWGRTRSDQYPGYEKFVEKAANYDFDRALADRKVLAGTPQDVHEQVVDVANRYGSDVCLSLQFNSGHLPVERAERAMELFATQVAPSLANRTEAAEAAATVS